MRTSLAAAVASSANSMYSRYPVNAGNQTKNQEPRKHSGRVKDKRRKHSQRMFSTSDFEQMNSSNTAI